MNRDEAQKRGIVTMSDLAKAVKGGAKLTFASNAEFYARPDGLPGWQTAYGFEFDRDNVKRMDTGLVYSALKDRQVDIGVVFATDGRIPAFNFVVLKDDKNYAAPYNLTPVVRKEILDKYPKIADALNALSAKLNDETMAKLNASVDVDKKTVEEVADGISQEQRSDLMAELATRPARHAARIAGAAAFVARARVRRRCRTTSSGRRCAACST